ncbi:MAG: hypothetical protein IIY78_02525 [Clostridia bacterium]|nr:hypothetical protein [Clostridia bacterium]
MAATYRTEHYGLCRWQGSDKPTRTDFVNDNIQIDSKLWEHASNAAVHLTATQKERVSDPFCIRVVQGTGTAQRTIVLDFAPTFVLYMKADNAPVRYTGTTTVVNAAAAVQNTGGTNGAALSGDTLVISHGVTGGVDYDLNNDQEQYIIFAMR